MDPVTIQIIPNMTLIKLMPNMLHNMMPIICTKQKDLVKSKICTSQKTGVLTLRIQNLICQTLKILNWVLSRVELQVLAEMTKARYHLVKILPKNNKMMLAYKVIVPLAIEK